MLGQMKKLTEKDFDGRWRLERVRLMSAAMRELTPPGWDEAAASVRKNINAAKRYTPHIFLPKN